MVITRQKERRASRLNRQLAQARKPSLIGVPGGFAGGRDAPVFVQVDGSLVGAVLTTEPLRRFRPHAANVDGVLGVIHAGIGVMPQWFVVTIEDHIPPILNPL